MAPLFVCLALSLAISGRARAQGTAAAPPPPPAKAETKTEAKAPAKADGQSTGKVKENIKQLGREVKDPGTLQRIKAHEQDFEKRVESKRAAQRKDHGAPRPGDAVDLAKGIDTPAAAAQAPSKDASKKKVETAPPAPPPAPPTK